MRAHRAPRRGAGVAAMLIGFFVAFLVAVGVYAWRVEPPDPAVRTDPVPRSNSGPFTASTLEKLVRNWSKELFTGPWGINETQLRKIPLHFVTDGGERTLEQVRMAQSRLMQDRLIHRSATLDASLRQVLDPGVTPQEVQKHLLEKLPGDTLPILVWVREKPAPGQGDSYFVEAHFYYRGMYRYHVGSVYRAEAPPRTPDEPNPPDWGRNHLGTEK
jgi:hypothetical protein